MVRNSVIDNIINSLDEDTYFLVSDLGGYQFPEHERIIHMGICESHIVNKAAGIASAGKKAVIIAYASFLTRRSFEQIYLNVGLHKANVKIFGMYAGSTMYNMGVTHIALDDISLMKIVPNISIYEISDRNSCNTHLRNILEEDGPAYIRINEEISTAFNNYLVPHPKYKFVDYKPGYNSSDVTIVYTGPLENYVAEIENLLSRKMISASIYKLSSYNRGDIFNVLSENCGSKLLLTFEDAYFYSSSLASFCKEVLAKMDVDKMHFSHNFKSRSNDKLLERELLIIDQLGDPRDIVNNVCDYLLGYV